MIITRTWAMPNSDTFSVRPIGDFVRRYLAESKCSIDPFARNTRLATYTNDLNPDTAAEYHMEAEEFIRMMIERGTTVDLAIFDPPYSVRQISECYKIVGKICTGKDTRSDAWTRWKSGIARLVKPGGIVLSFGWSTVGMGIKLGYQIEEIMMVCHGGAHNDTICMAERLIHGHLSL